MSFSASRRSFLKTGALVSLGACVPLELYSCAGIKPIPRRLASTLFPIPDLSDGAVLRSVVGLRPFRQKKICLEKANLGSKTLIHNYGHGGAGFTLAWGCAEAVANIVNEVHQKTRPVAVLGAGVIGLSAAKVLLERGFKVKLYAQEFSPNLTSDLAGAQWSPSAVSWGETPEERWTFEGFLIRSYRRYEQMVGTHYGVSQRLNYIADDIEGILPHVPPGLLPPVELLARLPFEGTPHHGKLFRTFLIEPPIFMPRIMQEV